MGQRTGQRTGQRMAGPEGTTTQSLRERAASGTLRCRPAGQPMCRNVLSLSFAPLLSEPGSRGLARRWRLACVTFLAGGSVLACGPSVQVLHEGTVRFEHCHRLDLDPQIAPSHRSACWQAWLERYSYGQPRDRQEYAQRRIASIERNEPPPGLNLDAKPERSLRDEPIGPIDAHAPPPKVAPPAESARTWEEAPLEDEAPGDDCARLCRDDRRACFEGCSGEDGAECPCEGVYRECMARCFELR